MARRPMLTRESIAHAALEALDEEGPEGLAMRSLARRLGVKAPSLYNHVASQDEIITLVHDLVDSEIDLTTLDDGDWRRGLAAFARSYRAAFLRHPHAVPIVVRRPLTAQNAVGTYGAAAAALVRAGVPIDQVMAVLALLDFIVLGSAVDNFIDGFAADPGDYDAEHPDLAAAIRSTDRARVDHVVFEHALVLLLDDVDARLTPRTPAARRRQRGAAAS